MALLSQVWTLTLWNEGSDLAGSRFPESGFLVLNLKATAFPRSRSHRHRQPTAGLLCGSIGATPQRFRRCPAAPAADTIPIAAKRLSSTRLYLEGSSINREADRLATEALQIQSSSFERREKRYGGIWDHRHVIWHNGVHFRHERLGQDLQAGETTEKIRSTGQRVQIGLRQVGLR